MRTQKGFTLPEILLSVMILAVGIVAVLQTLLGSVKALSYMTHRSEANRLLSKKIWEVQDSVVQTGKFSLTHEKGILLGIDKTYEYRIDSKKLDPKGELYEVTAHLSWQQTRRTKGFNRAFYVLVQPQKEA